VLDYVIISFVGSLNQYFSFESHHNLRTSNFFYISLVCPPPHRQTSSLILMRGGGCRMLATARFWTQRSG
jgi:hypothetical protein